MNDSSPSAEDFTSINVVDFPEQLGGSKARGPISTGSGGSGMSDGERITRLETHFEYIRKDLDDIKSDQKQALLKLSDLGDRIRDVDDKARELPTKNDLWAWKLQWTALSVAAIAIIVGGIIGGLGWIKADSAPPSAPSQMKVEPTEGSSLR